MEATIRDKNNATTSHEGEQFSNQGKEDEKLFSCSVADTFESFEDLNLKEDLLRGVFGCGFVKPSPFQKKAIKPMIMRKDMIAQARSGAGKTASFIISMLQNIDHQDFKLQALILTPTRELAFGIAELIKNLSCHLKVAVHVCTGGTQTVEDKKKLPEGIQIVCSTPVRFIDMMKRQILNPAYLKMLIIDEADEILSRGLLDQIQEIIKMIAADFQFCFFTATISSEMIKLAEGAMNDPVKIFETKGNSILPNIKQFYLSCPDDINKYEQLFQILAKIKPKQCVIYVNTKDKAEDLAARMRDEDFVVSCIHGSIEPAKKDAVMREFREGTSHILISADLLARSLSISYVELVINFELPIKKEDYICRVLLAAGYERRGAVVNLISAHEASPLIEIQDLYHLYIDQLPCDLTEIEKII